MGRSVLFLSREKLNLPDFLKDFLDEKSPQICYAKHMKRQMIKIMNFILITSLILALAIPVAEPMPRVHATSISQVKDNIENAQNQLEQINEHLIALQDEQDLLAEQIDDINAEIINTMTSIGLKEDEIVVKEVELTDKQGEIDKTQKEYEAAKAKEEKQYADMVTRVQKMYEMGSGNFLHLFLQGKGFSEILNRMDFVEHIYKFDRLQLESYVETKNLVHALWDQLELEKENLEKDKAQLEVDKAVLQEQKSTLDGMLAAKKQESSNYEAEIKRARQEAAVAKKLLQQEQKKLKQLQAQQNQSQSNSGQSNAANGNYATTSYTSTIDNASGSDLGKKVAKYACQYIGNPYVYGGTSLTNGADCSGFVYRVYKDFGYNLPRTSYEQRSAGTGVEYSQAEPGDLICYDGHIGIYIGGGLIVHASSAKTGIKVSRAGYRSILAVRRIV